MKRIIFTLLGILLYCNLAAAAESRNLSDPFYKAQGKYAVGTTFFSWNDADSQERKYIGQITF